MLGLAFRSLWNRRFVAALTVLSIALSVALILGVERLRSEARNSFTNSASGIDLIVAPRGNSVQILMATVFGVGSTGTGLAWETYEVVEELPQVEWLVPIQMGDNHRGYPVIGTTAAYFERFRHTGGRPLTFAAGEAFGDDMPDAAVIGAEVAARFDYVPGTVIVNAHGAGAVSFDLHDDAPFTITGVLAPTGTAVDRMVFVTLQGFDEIHAARIPPPEDPFDLAEPRPEHDAGEAGEVAGSAFDDHADAHDEAEHTADVHADHEGADNHALADDHGETGNDEAHGGHALADDHDAHSDDDGEAHALTENAGHDDAEDAHGSHDGDDHAHADGEDPEAHDDHHHEPATINAIYIGLSERTAVLGVQRTLSELRTDAVSAVIPAVALNELWSITGTAERAMQAMAWAVAAAGMTGMVVMLSATLDARRREFAILRSVGATPGRVFTLIVTEAAVLMGAGLVCGLVVLGIAVQAAGPVLASNFGLTLDLGSVEPRDLALLVAIFGAGIAASLVPAFRVYRMTLADGLSVRL